jgi:hypothetical protein
MMKKLLFFLLAGYLFAAIVKIENPKEIYYQNQIADFNIKVITNTKTNISIIAPKDTKYKIHNKNGYVHEINLTTKVTKPMPKIIVTGKHLYKKINFKDLNIVKLNPPKNFSGVLAEKLKISNVIAAKNDKNSIILSFDINTKKANLKDFHLPYEEKLTIRNDNLASYYVILPKNTNNLKFSYFNLKEKNFKQITIPVILKGETISTQTNINPEEGGFFSPINILLLTLIAFSLIIFLIYKKLFLLVFPIIFAGILIYPYFPKGEITIPKNTNIYLLPTSQSTAFYITKKNQTVKVLKKINGYYKVEINNKIGWVKEKDVK